MRVFVAGATGAIGRQLVPRLVAAGHEVVGMTSKESNRGFVGELGATPVVADALDPDQVAEAVGRANPEVIVDQLTAIGSLDMRHFDRDFAVLTNRLRSDGTDHLLSAGRAVGVRRFVAQSAVYGIYARAGGTVKSEEDPLDPSPPRSPPRPSPRSGIWRRRCSVPSGRRGSCCATAPSTVRARRCPRAASSSRWSESARLPTGRRRWRGVVVRSHRRRRRGDGCRGRPRKAWYLQHRGRRSGTGGAVAAGAGSGALSQEADARASVCRADVRGRDRGSVHDRDPRRLEREGRARAGVASQA